MKVLLFLLGTFAFAFAKQPIGNELRSDPCKICQDFLADVNGLINEKWIQKGLQVILNKACDVLPEKNAEACHETVNNYMQKITAFIANKVLAPANCKNLLHCDLIDSSRDFSICDALGDIYKEIPQIVDQAEEICDELPVVELQQTCHDTFTQYKGKVEEIAQNAVKWISDHIPFVHCNLPQLTVQLNPLVLRSDPCKICETFMNDVDALITQRWIQQGLKVVLNKACDLLPSEKNAEACHETVNNYIQKITDFIGNKILAPQNCKTLFHCDIIDASRNFSICDTLQTIYDDIPKIVDMAEEICDELPVVELQQTCHDTFSKYKGQVEQMAQSTVKWISDHIPFVHCDLPEQLIMMSQPMVLRSDPCKICSNIVNKLATAINQKFFQQQLKTILSTACSYIPEQKYADACVQTVTDDIDVITKFIGEHILSADNCVKLLHCDDLDSTRDFSICNALLTIYGDVRIVVEQAEAICDELPVVEVQQTCHETFAKYSPQIAEMVEGVIKFVGTHIPFVSCQWPDHTMLIQGQVFRSDPCKICETFMNDVDALITQRWIQQGLKVVLNKACDLLPNEKNADACHETVNNYIEKITDFIKNKVLAPEKCKTLLHCDLIDASRNFSLCDTLQTIYDDIPKIVDQAEEICDELPVVELQQTCHDTFSKYKGQVEQMAQNAVKWISDHIPFVHCDLPQQLIVQQQLVGNVFRSDPCKICQTLTGDLITLINEKWIQHGLQVVLRKACSLIPNQQNADACVQTVDNYIQKITDFIANKVLAPENCKTLLHCDQIDSSRDFSLCDALKTIYEDIPKIVDEAEEICDELPVTELQQTCHDTFSKYKGQVNQIAQNAVKWISEHIPFIHCSIAQPQMLMIQPQNFRSDPCKMCQTFLTDLSVLINQKWLQQGLKVILEKTCALLPVQKNADACTETVNNYIGKIATFIDNKILATQNCKSILHCDIVDSTRDFSLCDALEGIYDEIPEVVNQAEQVCDEIPVTELQQTCHDTFAKYKGQVEQIAQNAIKWISDHIPFIHCNISQPTF